MRGCICEINGSCTVVIDIIKIQFVRKVYHLKSALTVKSTEFCICFILMDSNHWPESGVWIKNND